MCKARHQKHDVFFFLHFEGFHDSLIMKHLPEAVSIKGYTYSFLGIGKYYNYFLFAHLQTCSVYLYTADQVHLLPGYPSNGSGSVQVAFYVQQPRGLFIGNVSVLPRGTLVDIIKTHKSALETVIGAAISRVEALFKPATSPLVSSPSSTKETITKATPRPASVDDGKWIAIGVGAGVGLLLLILFLIWWYDYFQRLTP